MTEFEIIEHYFNQPTQIKDAHVLLGIGDDGAIVDVPHDQPLVITTDTLVSGIHFFADTAPELIGHKSLAVNLSDLAAMGATPKWATLALTAAKDNPTWLQAFCRGFFALAKEHELSLIGGDLTHGPLSITITAFGLLPTKQSALLRSGAKPGDIIYVTGTLGDAGAALAYMKHQITIDKTDLRADLIARLNQPQPRIAIGKQLLNRANAAIDISDGLVADLTHILVRSHVGAVIHLDRIPLSSALRSTVDHEQALQFALTSGDDYELCFTAPPDVDIHQVSAPCPITAIGEITKELDLKLLNADGSLYRGNIQGYQHF